MLSASSYPKHFLKKHFLKKTESIKKWNWFPATKMSLNNLTNIETPSQFASKNFAKTWIYLAVYISLNWGIVVSKISNKLQGVN